MKILQKKSKYDIIKVKGVFMNFNITGKGNLYG